MSVWRKYIIIAPVTLSIAFLVTACNDSKSAQCERLITVVNKGTDLIDNSKGQQVVTSLKLAHDLEAVTKELKDLKFKDPKLKEFQNRFMNVFETFSQSISKAAMALYSAKTAKASFDGRVIIEKARGEIDTALTPATTAAQQSDALASQVNKHCSSKSE
ncbi:MAG: hypothetical protein DSM106950_00145 [Stigonema ocellatum SAG 48.90 = DSM 106950]|nr:hypothetical protein [Stigonema ocellatum SAG 48.90 = DSM 106950]